MTKGRRASDRRREREQGAFEEIGPEIAPSDETQARPDDATKQTVAPSPEALERLDETRGQNVDESTRLNERTPRPPPAGLRLKVGDAAPIDVTVTPAVLGRSQECDIRFDDATVSKKHAQLVRLDEGEWLLSDLGSKSGTAVNGSLVTAPMSVAHGDVVELGPITFRLAFGQVAPKDKPAVVEKTQITVVTQAKGKTVITAKPVVVPSEKKRRRGIVAAAIVAVLLVVGGALAGVALSIASGKDSAAVAAQVDELYAEADELFQRGDFAGARARLDALFALAPGHLRAESLAKLIASEEDSARALAEAERLLAQGDVDGCRAALARIPNASRFAAERDRVRAKIDDKARFGQRSEIEGLLEAGDLDRALQRINALLAERPNDPDLLELKARIERALARRGAEPGDLVRARAAFAVGNASQAKVVAQALAEKGDARARRFVADIDTWSDAKADGEKALAKKDARRAEDALARAYDLARSLAGPAGARGLAVDDAARALADALFLAGVADENAGKACDGAKKIVRAYALDQSDGKIASKKRALDAKAEAGLERARARLDAKPDQAKQIAREHLCFASSSSATGRALAEIAR